MRRLALLYTSGTGFTKYVPAVKGLIGIAYKGKVWLFYAIEWHVLTLSTYNKSAVDDFENNYAKILNKFINERKIIQQSWKYCGKMRNCSSWAISSFAMMFSKVVCCRGVRKRLYVGKSENCIPDLHLF